MKQTFLTAAALTIAASMNAAITYHVRQTDGWWWNAPQQPVVEVCVKNDGAEAATADVSLRLETDTHEHLQTLGQQVRVAAGDSVDVRFTFPVAPGFYRVSVSGTGSPAGPGQYVTKEKDAVRFNIGYEPENVVSLPDAQPDFQAFWDRTIAELAEVAPEYEMTEDTEKSNKTGRVYVVKMKSWGGEQVQGYLTVPRKASKKNRLPVIVHYMGYSSKPWYPHPDSNPDFIEFVLSGRGQGLCEPDNKYGDWIVYGLEDKEGYYYRGAFMDLLRALDFIETLPEADTRNIFGEGGSQGGAFTLAACALDPKKRIRAAAPSIPFLSDFRDYFRIEAWPATPIQQKQKAQWMSDEQLYRTLSYFDIKNHARQITCPILMGIGLQDPTCPPHTNVSSYNLLRVPKQLVIYTNQGHDPEHPDWDRRIIDFYRSQMVK